MPQRQCNPAFLEVIRCNLESIAEEMGAVLSQAALSPNLRERQAFSCAIYTPGGLLVAQAGYVPLHLGPLLLLARGVLEEYPLAELEAKDVIILNEPSLTGSHPADVCVLSPVFYQGRVLALVATLAHHADVGGCLPGTMSTTSTEVRQEGLCIPPLKLFQRGKLNWDMFKLLTHNLRVKQGFWGDIQAQVAANNHGARRLAELASRYGPFNLHHYMNELINCTERKLIASLGVIPQGTYIFEDYLEGDGLEESLVNVRAAVTRDEKGLKVDFTGTHPQVRGPFNATRAITLSCVYYVLKALLDPELPFNAGFTKVVEVVTPSGSLVNPLPPAPLAHAGTTAQRLVDVLLGALAKALPHRVTAAGTGSVNGLTIGGVDPSTGGYYVYTETFGGGQGAKHNQDGADGVHVHMTNVRNIPVEVLERTYPLLVERYALVRDSGGAGKYRGGLGIVREMKILRGRAVVAIGLERARLTPWGLNGGLPGEKAKVRVIGPDGKEDEAKTGKGKLTFDAPAGTRIILQTAGGGGFGCPLERDPELVRQDVVEGLVSRQAAEKIYGVVFTAELAVDYEKTAKRRKELKAGLGTVSVI